MSEQRPIVVILKRAIPVDGCTTDTLTRVCDPSTRIGEIVTWSHEKCVGQASLISLEVVEAES